MINNSKKLNILGLVIVALGFILISGEGRQVGAQERDPFAQPSWKNPKPVPVPGAAGKTADGKPIEKIKIGPAPVGIPVIQDRLNYFKRIREEAIQNNQPYAQPTSVMTLEELSVTGIFRTPKGMAAMVEAVPIGLSYTVYPGEKFFNGQLVAIEENKLIFRKVTKMSDGKFVASEDNKMLRQYTQLEELQGTAPADTSKPETAKSNQPVPPAGQQTTASPTDPKPAPVTAIISPLDEMNKPVETPKTAKVSTDKKGKTSSSSVKKGVKKPEKVAENKVP